MYQGDGIVSETPPQFAPRGRRERPTAAGARRVGTPAAGPDHTRVMPTEPAAAPPPAARTPSAPPSPARRPLTAPATPAATPAPQPTRPPQEPRPASAQRPAATHAPAPTPAPVPSRPSTSRPSTSRRRRWPALLALVLAVLLAWPIGLLIWANGLIAHTSALTGAPNTPGTTYLLVGSDSRADGAVTDGAEGQRSDSLLVLHRAANGRSALISLPRDTYVQIEGYGGNKINASYAFGGAPLLTSTVEQLTGLTVDHYVEIGMGGVVSVVDAVGGVNLCLDYDVNDELSQLVWTAGCHDVDGTTALAFARMRYSDPLGDIGRQARQRQVIGAIVQRTATPSTLLNPFAQLRIIETGTGALTTDEETGIVDLARLGLAFRSATGADGVTGAPPIADFSYYPGGVGATVLLDEALTPQFFQKLRDGELTQADIQQFG